MSRNTTLTAMVVSAPAGLRKPSPAPGQSIATFVIQQWPQQWENLKERLQRDFGVPKQICATLYHNGKLQTLTDPRAQAEVMRFMNMRLPAHWRTVKGLAELREALAEPALRQMGSLELIQILCPRERAPAGQASDVQELQALGAEIVTIETGQRMALDFSDHLLRVRGDLLWVVPGCTRIFSPPLAAMALLRVERSFQQNERLALYSDGVYSFVYRTRALRELFDRRGDLGVETRQHARMLQEAGYELAADREGTATLCDLEPIYGGRASVPEKTQRKGFLDRLLGR